MLKKRIKLTKREKIVASVCNPYYGKFATRKEVKAAKLKARGHYWMDRDYEEYVAFTSYGRRYFFEFYRGNKKDIERCKKSAKLWVKNKLREALDLYRYV